MLFINAHLLRAKFLRVHLPKECPSRTQQSKGVRMNRKHLLWAASLMYAAGCAEGLEDPAPIQVSNSPAETTARSKVYQPFADKNNNGKYDSTDTLLKFSGTTLTSSHSIVIPKVRGAFLYTKDNLTIRSGGTLTINQDFSCQPGST